MSSYTVTIILKRTFHDQYLALENSILKREIEESGQFLVGREVRSRYRDEVEYSSKRKHTKQQIEILLTYLIRNFSRLSGRGHIVIRF